MRIIACVAACVPLAAALAWGAATPARGGQSQNNPPARSAPPPRQAAPPVMAGPAPRAMLQPGAGNVMRQPQSFGGAGVPGGMAGARTQISPPHIPSGAAPAPAAANAAAVHIPSTVTAPRYPNNVTAPGMPNPVASTLPGAGYGAHVPSSLNAGHGLDTRGAYPGASPYAAHLPQPARGGGPFDRGRERAIVLAHQHDFHTSDVRMFNGREAAVWRTGRWRHEEHYGQYGWWWAVDDVWYPYPAPIYPYPLVVTTPDAILAILGGVMQEFAR